MLAGGYALSNGKLLPRSFDVDMFLLVGGSLPTASEHWRVLRYLFGRLSVSKMNKINKIIGRF